MRLLIGFSKTKREINGSFSICGSKDDLVAMAQQILWRAERDDFHYGWIDVYADRTPALANTPPIPWDEMRKDE